MTIPARIQERSLILSKLAQTVYGTALTDGNLQAGKRVSPESAFMPQPSVMRWTDQSLAMKGFNYSTQVSEIQRDLADTLALTGDSWLLAWAFAFAMGTSVASQPDNINAPTAYQHVIKPQDPVANGKNLPVTTIYAEGSGAANLERRLLDMVVKQLTLSVPGKGSPLKLSVDMVGSGRTTAGLLASQPALMTLVPLFSQNLIFKYGAQGAPTDISSQIVDGSVKLTFTWNFDDGNSRAPSGGIYRSRAWLTQPDITLTFNRFVDDADSTPNDDFFAQTIRECRFSVAGPNLGGAVFHSLDVRLLAVIPSVVKLGQSGDKTVYQYTIGKDHMLKQGSNDVIVVTCVNTETSFLV
jgi:hypothetical protein